MADPLSVTASVAGIVSLADILLRTGKEVYAFFSAVKEASKNIQSMLVELQQFDGILISIKKNADSFNNSLFTTDDGHSASGLLTDLQYCEAEFKIQQSTTKTHEKLSIGFMAIQSDTTTLKRKFEESREAVTSNTEVIRRDISRANSGVLQVVQTGIEQSAKRQRRLARGLARQQANSTIQSQQRLDRMQAMLSNIGANPLVGTVPPVNVTTTENLDVIVMPLLLMKSKLPEAISMLESGGQAFLSKEDAEFLQSEVNEILAAAYVASSVALKRPQSAGEVGESASLNHSLNTDSRRPKSYGPCTQPHLTKELPLMAAWKQFAHQIFVGMLSIGIQKEPGILSSAISTSVTLMPKPEISKLGVSIVWTKEMRAAINPRINRSIRTFQILAGDYTHPAVCAVQNNNTLELQRMLSAKEISPWDRNSENHNLVHHAIFNGAYDVTRLLLEEGATAHDSAWGKLNALWNVWFAYGEIIGQRIYPEGKPIYVAPDDLEFWIDLSDLVIRYGASAEECVNLLDYGNLLFLPSQYQSIPFAGLWTLYKYLIRIGSDIEARNKKGQTPLLYTAYSHWESSIDWLSILLANDADLTAQDNGGRGGFHQMF
ncbi:hypothetical protein MMC30_008501 [Trapelia coarctata]|nr:hypothetical protein [Trapelia coarctata]